MLVARQSCRSVEPIPDDIVRKLQRQLNNATSPLRSGAFALLLNGSRLEVTTRTPSDETHSNARFSALISRFAILAWAAAIASRVGVA
mmetsp:Transcript_60198/g.196695  ORF Transcript_60198/g.196695 Transcript_60198/m.196695 type:complete len:88 (+) Transcript_60198:36-299(+)